MKVFIRIIFVDVYKSSFEIIIGQKWYFKSIISKEDDFERTSYRTLQNSVIVRTN